MKRKGLLNQIYIVVIIAVILITIIGLFSLASIVLPILVGEGNLVTNIIQTDLQNSGIEPLQNASTTPTETISGILGAVELIVYFLFLGLIIGFIIIAYYVRTYPFLAFFWAGIMVILVIMAMIMSNAYEQAKNEPDLQAFYTTWGSNDLIMSYLPHIIASIGILGGIVLFVLVSRETESDVQRL